MGKSFARTKDNNKTIHVYVRLQRALKSYLFLGINNENIEHQTDKLSSAATKTHSSAEENSKIAKQHSWWERKYTNTNKLRKLQIGKTINIIMNLENSENHFKWLPRA